jgi:hypothetical protein
VATRKIRKRTSAKKSVHARRSRRARVQHVTEPVATLTSTASVGKPRPADNLSEYELKVQLAMEHDARMKELEERSVAAWSEMAEIAQLVHDNREWEVLGCTSFNDWLETSAPRSRALIYDHMKLLKCLNSDIPQTELRQMRPETAKVLRYLPSKMRKDPKVLEKAKTLPAKEFTRQIQTEAPELHIERRLGTKYNFEASQKRTIEAAIQMANILEAGQPLDEPMISDEVALEKICASYLLANKETYDHIIDGSLAEAQAARAVDDWEEQRDVG